MHIVEFLTQKTARAPPHPFPHPLKILELKLLQHSGDDNHIIASASFWLKLTINMALCCPGPNDMIVDRELSGKRHSIRLNLAIGLLMIGGLAFIFIILAICVVFTLKHLPMNLYLL